MQPSNSAAAMPAFGLYGTRIPSPRQQQVIELVAQGLKNSEVAEVIGTTEYVVKNHLRVIFDKLGCWNRVELALWYEARKHERLAYTQRDPAMTIMRPASSLAALCVVENRYDHPAALLAGQRTGK